MRTPGALAIWTVAIGIAASGHSDDGAKTIRKAVERSTLDQAGTKPFHLKATIAPSFERFKSSNRTGSVEIWWVSPRQWRRELHSPEFQQIKIVSGDEIWEKDDGDYFPEWLREVTVALTDPIPDLDEVLNRIKEANKLSGIGGATEFSWTRMSSDGNIQKGEGAGIYISQTAGLLSYGGDLGWHGSFDKYKDFHGRMVARKVDSGEIQVTADVATLEDLPTTPAGFFDAKASSGDSRPIETLVVDELSLRKNLLPQDPPSWPPVQDGPLQGGITTEIVVDRRGKVRDIGSILTDNPGTAETAGKWIAAMQFEPYLKNGEPVQVVSRITMPFKTVRPGGAEMFDSAYNFFERGRKNCFPAAGSGTPYVIRATFRVMVKSGKVEEGQYVDTWVSDTQWRREATSGNSKFVRSREGDKRYQLGEGSDAELLRYVLWVMEPIPAIDTFIESDWRIKRDTVDGIKTIRVLAGHEGPDGTLDPEQARGFWFDDSGKLLKTFGHAMETKRFDFESFDGAMMAREVKVFKDGKLAMLIQVADSSALGDVSKDTFKLKGHEWKRMFTAETR